LPSIRRRARVWVLAVPCLCLEESIESPARSGIGPARLNIGLQLPCSVQMAFRFGGVQPPQCPRAFTMAWTGGGMEPRDLPGWFSSPDNIGNPMWSPGWLTTAMTPWHQAIRKYSEPLGICRTQGRPRQAFWKFRVLIDTSYINL